MDHYLSRKKSYILRHTRVWRRYIRVRQMRQYAVGSATLAICLCMSAMKAYPSELKWSFTSLVGQQIWISYQEKKSEYALTVGDVTQKVPSCEALSMQVCFSSSTVDLAIPRRKPNVGDTWSVAGTTWRVVAMIGNLELLGESYKDVFVVLATKNLLSRPGVRRQKVFYTYQHGLLAFQEETENGPRGAFIASTLPSVGARERIAQN